MLQALLVALLVGAAFVYSTWTLMPAAWRRALARRLLRLPALAGVAALRRAAAAGGGGCGSCGDEHCAAPTVKPVTLHRPPR